MRHDLAFDVPHLPDVLFDVDGVFADFITPALAEVTKITGVPYNHDDIKEWDIMSSLGVSQDVAKQAYEAMHRRGFCLEIQPYPGAIEKFEALKEVCNPYIVTAPMQSPYWAHEREEWLLANFGIPHKRVISTQAKHKCAGDAFIDDKTANLVAWRLAHPSGCAIRWDVFSNSSEPWDGVRTHNWDELRGIIIGLGVFKKRSMHASNR